MHIKGMIVEGFKSYGQRVEINGFDREFNAITGLNGSGKSNILDAICFVLGISNLGQVRAASLQDLVYKSGQAGITKASVTIKFDNRDSNNSPIGYEQYEEITVTRQTIVGGKNKYLINGSNVTNKRVMDMFCSVQLNVNNPHFLIMQGRITKVLNMKPPEILSMIEEAAGTRMYETKKQAAQKTIEKKDAKLRELDELIKEEISPKLQKLKDERSQYLEYQNVLRQVESLTRLFVAWKYVQALETSDKANEKMEQVKQEINENTRNIDNGKKEIVDIGKSIEDKQQLISAELGGQLKEVEEKLSAKEKEEAKLIAKQKSNKDSICCEKKRLKQLEKSKKEDEAALAAKNAELGKADGVFAALKDAEAADAEALAAAQRKFQAVSAGLVSSDDGQEATLQDQLMAAQQEVTTAETEIKQSQMQIEHSKAQLSKKQQMLGGSEKGYTQDLANLQKMEKEVATLSAQMQSLNYDDGLLEKLQDECQYLRQTVRNEGHAVHAMEARNAKLCFNYTDPEPNFDRSKVRGLVCRMFRVKDPQFAMALESAGSSRLYFVVVDSEVTSKKILQRGNLQRRTTIIPLNKISGRSMDEKTIRTAQNLVGRDKVFPALDLIEYEPGVHSAMEWIFGQVFICTDTDTARRVCYDERIQKRCVTLDGDVFDPSGTLSGGAAVQTEPVLSALEKLMQAQESLKKNEEELARVEQQIREVSQTAERYKGIKQRFDLKSHEANLLRQRLEQTDHHQLTVEIQELKTELEELAKKVTGCRQTIKDTQAKVKSLETKIKDSKKIREQELKAAQAEMVKIQKRADESRTKWKKREQEYETLHLEIKELSSAIETTSKQIEDLTNALEEISNEDTELVGKLSSVKEELTGLQAEVRSQKDAISKQNKEIQEMNRRKDRLLKSIGEWELAIKQLEHDLSKIQSETKDAKSRVTQLAREYDWVETDKQYFGQKNGMYDFSEHNMQEVGGRLSKLKELKDKLGRSVNTRAMNLLGKEEEQYNDVMRKKNIVENDKKSIMAVIKELDEKKKKALQTAHKQVNKDFGSIFSTLLPGATAKLEPPHGMSVLDGLEVKVGFGEIWKESLGELSGGQRSLVALSLILAMLLFKPAPIYILDEVDAALDLSHTQNIGNMLKAHFKASQFIVVSLKDGMFNNANVLFRTKFVDGMSTVTRTVQHQNQNENEKDSAPVRKRL